MNAVTPNLRPVREQSVTDALHDLFNAAEMLREMIANRTPESAEMAAIEVRWAANREKRA